MTLLIIAQRVCGVIGITRPTAIVTGQNELAYQILGLAEEALEELSLMDWPVLQVPYTFDTVVDQAQYDLPADWGRETGDTAYAASQYNQLRGSLSPAQWQNQRDALQAQIGRYRFRIFGQPLQLNITPTPQTVEAVTLEYQTTNRVRQNDGTFKASFFADDDTSIVPETLLYKGLKWRLRRAKGLDYSEEFDDYEKDRFAQLAQQLQFGSQPVAVRNGTEQPWSDPYVPENGFG